MYSSTLTIVDQVNNDTLNPTYNSKNNELRPDDNTTERLNKSNDLDDKSDFQTEQIDSPVTSRNLEVCDKDSEEWEELSRGLHSRPGESPGQSQTKAKEINIISLKPSVKSKQPGK